ncbi:MAG: hypothetical protein K5799_14940 [Erythrobacter sp.]|nr:hypothetical protein [Erythrobacter sp.]
MSTSPSSPSADPAFGSTQEDRWDHDEQFHHVVTFLEKAAARSRRIAYIAFGAGVVGVALAVELGRRATSDGAEVLEQSGYSAVAAVYELLRTAAVAALLGAALWGILNLARAALDQATRYEKRMVAGHFLVFMLKRFDTKIKDDDVKLDQVMNVFKLWSDNVESAYTHVKFGSKKNQALSVIANPNGVGFATGGAEPVVPMKKE